VEVQLELSTKHNDTDEEKYINQCTTILPQKYVSFINLLISHLVSNQYAKCMAELQKISRIIGMKTRWKFFILIVRVYIFTCGSSTSALKLGDIFVHQFLDCLKYIWHR
jgi:hypothetical protein